jgi:Flp pilus assembly protein TadD
MGSGKTDTIGRVRWLFAVLVANLAALCLAADLTPGMREAVTALQRGDFTSAETKLRAELKLRPNDGEAR